MQKLYLIPVLLLINLSFTALGQRPKVSLSQGKNGQPSAPISPVDWWHGNLNNSDNHYSENQSIPYRAIIDRIPQNTEVKLRIGYAVVRSGQILMDYLTSYDYPGSHAATYGHSFETVDPTLGFVGNFSGPSFFQLPQPGSINSPVPGQPQNSFSALPSNYRRMAIWNGVITGINYLVLPDFNLGANIIDAIVEINFIATGSPVILAWGGHLASQPDWGVNLTNNIFGCPPCRMRLESLELFSPATSATSAVGEVTEFIQIGNQERTYLGGGKPINPVGEQNKETIPGAESSGLHSKIIIYPNPNHGTLQIVVPSEAGMVDLKLEDMNGRTIQFWPAIRSRTIRFSILAPGIYILRIRSVETAREEYRKIVVTN